MAIDSLSLKNERSWTLSLGSFAPASTAPEHRRRAASDTLGFTVQLIHQVYTYTEQIRKAEKSRLVFYIQCLRIFFFFYYSFNSNLPRKNVDQEFLKSRYNTHLSLALEAGTL